MLVRERMSRNVVMTTADRPLGEIRTMLHRRRIRQLPVVADSKVIGIVTDRDLRSAGSRAKVVADIMTRKLLVIAPTASVDEAARVLRSRKINALPVLEHERLVGIITASDVLEAFVDLSGVAESTYRLVLSGAAGGLREVRRIVERHGGELKWTYVQGGGRRGSIHVRLKTRQLDDLTTALEGAGFEVNAVVATRSTPAKLARGKARRSQAI